MKVESIVLGSIGTNCYIVTNEETKECFAVDMAECPQEYVNYIKNNGLEMKALFLTHGHFDHIMGIDDFLKAFPVPVYAGEDELPVIEDDRLNVSSMYGPKYAFHGAKPVKDGQVIECAGTYSRSMLLLPSKRTQTVQRRYTVLCFHRKNRPPDRKQQPAGPLCTGEDHDTSG